MKFKIIVLSIFVFSLLGNGQNVFAQQVNKTADTTKNLSGYRNDRLFVSIDVGYQAAGSSFPVNAVSDDQGFISASLVVDGSVDYFIWKTVSIGASVAYQSTVYVQDYGIYQTENLTMLNTAIRVLVHLNKHNTNHFDDYLGVRPGYSRLTDQFATNLSPSQGAPRLFAFGEPVVYRFSFQVLYGLTYYIGSVGFNAEVGFGTPFLAQVGVVERF